MKTILITLIALALTACATQELSEADKDALFEAKYGTKTQ